MKMESRRKRIERLKIYIRILRFIKKRMFAVCSGVIIIGAVVYSLNGVEAKGNIGGEVQGFSVKLENNTWCTSNKILVSAEDELPVLYLYSCPESKEDSGWISHNYYEVNHNGLWEIQVRDSAGNIAKAEITVSNIDKEPPVIESIEIVEEGGKKRK